MRGRERTAPSARHMAGLCLLCVSLVAGCMGGATMNPHESLPEALRDYHSQLVWGRYGEAATYLPADQQVEFNLIFEEQEEDLRFVEYELGTVQNNEETGQATVLVKIKWYIIPEYVVQETRVREVWELGEDDDYWWLIQRTDADAEEDEPAPPALSAEPALSAQPAQSADSR